MLQCFLLSCSTCSAVAITGVLLVIPCVITRVSLLVFLLYLIHLTMKTWPTCGKLTSTGTGQLDPNSAGISIRGNHNVIHHNLVYGNRGAGIRLGGDTNTCDIYNDVYSNFLEANQEGGLKIMRMPQGRVCSNRIVQPADWSEVRWGRNLKRIPLQECKK